MALSPNASPPSPETGPLLAKLDALKTEYIKLLNDKDVLLNWGKPQLEALYTSRIGRAQIDLLQQKLRVKALKRKIEMIQSLAARAEPVDLTAIELRVADELAAAELQIMGEAAKLQAATIMLANLDTPQRSSELRQIFKAMAKVLHPDANPGLPAELSHIWHQVKAAYEHGDLGRLKALQVLYEGELQGAAAGIESLTEAQITLQIEVLKEGVKVLIEEVAAIRAAFPFSIEAQIKDEDWVAAKNRETGEEMERLRAYEEELVAEYSNLAMLYGSTGPHQ